MHTRCCSSVYYSEVFALITTGSSATALVEMPMGVGLPRCTTKFSAGDGDRQGRLRARLPRVPAPAPGAARAAGRLGSVELQLFQRSPLVFLRLLGRGVLRLLLLALALDIHAVLSVRLLHVFFQIL